MKRFLLLAAAPLTGQPTAPVPYQVPSLAIEARVSDLLHRMTMEEEVAHST